MLGPRLAVAIALLLTSFRTAGAEGAASAGERAREAFAVAMRALEAGDLAAAEQGFAAAAGFVPRWALAHLQLGITRLALDTSDPAAHQALETAVRLEPRNPRARLHLGTAYERLGRFDEAARELRAAVALRPDLDDARYALAHSLAALGQDDEAIGLYTEIVDRAPGHAGALAALALLYERGGRLGPAEAALLTMTRVYPDVPYHRYRLAEFYERIGETAKARRVYAQLEELDPRRREMRKLR